MGDTNVDDVPDSRSARAPAPGIVCLGESMVLVTPAASTPLREATQAWLRVAGAESNTAQYLADLGHRVTWVSRVGADPLGERIVSEIAASGVGTRAVVRDPGAPTAVYFKDPAPEKTDVYYYRTGSAASRLSPRDLDAVDLSAGPLAYTSGVTVALSASCAEAVSVLFDRTREAGGVRAFDVNHRAGLWNTGEASTALLDTARRADIVLVGLDEAAVLWGTASPDDVRDLIGGPARLIVKDADVGATLFDETGRHFEPAEKVEVVEPVGAGDAFAAGYLSALLAGAPPGACLRLGHRTAALALGSTADHVDASHLRALREVRS
ncbi:sugar kinase [Actinoallomurus acaciae]|uniref:Sugar kinase n=1 Tax=Actinoallomurus acaciae TaxID=502577 RepID=A0ABV5YDU5_9ACTN